MEVVDNKVVEDIDVGIEYHTEKLYLKVIMRRKFENDSFDYHINVDEDGQLVITPNSTGAKFIDVYPVAGYTDTTTEDDITTKKFVLNLEAAMIAEDSNFDWFYDIDDIGQIVICPDAESTSFVSVVEDNNLNLVTNEALEDDIVVEDKPAMCDMLKELSDAVSALQSVVDRMRAMCACEEQSDEDIVNSAEEEMVEEPQVATTIVEVAPVEEVVEVFAVPDKKVELEEDLAPEFDEEHKLKVIDRFTKGDITILPADKVPTADTIVRMEELDDKTSAIPCEFYYDTESDVVVYVSQQSREEEC